MKYLVTCSISTRLGAIIAGTIGALNNLFGQVQHHVTWGEALPDAFVSFVVTAIVVNVLLDAAVDGGTAEEVEDDYE